MVALPDLQDLVYRGTLDEIFDVLLELEALRGRDGVEVVRELEELLRQARVSRLVEAPLLPHAAGDRPQDGVGHTTQVAQRLVAVLAGAEVHLGHSPETNALEDVDHDPGLHRVAGEEGDGAEEVTVRDELPGKGLHEAGELRVEEVE